MRKSLICRRRRAGTAVLLRVMLLPGMLLFAPLRESSADTIVLKNGRTIVAEAVTEVGDKVVYEGEAGPISIPKSIVERIEKGGAMPVRRAPAAATGGRASAITPESLPQIRLQLGVAGLPEIMRDGAVDERRLAELASQAYDGESELQIAVNAHLLAAAHEARAERLAAASRWAEEALGLAPQDRNALLLATQIDLARRQYSEALNHMLVAQRVAPDSPDVLTLLGDAYYFSEGAERAIRYWKQADALRPDPRLRGRIHQAEQEAQVESALEQAESYHFVLNWEGSQAPASFGREILEALEQQYRELENDLNFSPREAILVILYTSQQFQDITRAPGWAGAVNDGKIRIPVQGLTSLTSGLAQVLKHEMVHSFVHQIAEGRCPTWLNEGLAQMQSGEDSRRHGGALSQLYGAGQQIPIAQLEGSFRRFNSGQAAVAYAESLAVVEMIRDRYGAYQLPYLLRALKEGSMTQALRSVLRMSYDDLETELRAYLAQKYG